MSRPLVADHKRQSEAAQWHREVFAMWGKRCVLCKRKGDATDAAHVIHRPVLGPLRYASPHFGRPLHRDCHEKVDRYEIDWPVTIVRDAVKAHNKIAKVALVMP